MMILKSFLLSQIYFLHQRDKQQTAIDTVLKQAELLANNLTALEQVFASRYLSGQATSRILQDKRASTSSTFKN